MKVSDVKDRPTAYSNSCLLEPGQGVALIETLKVIGEKGVRITPDVMASGGSGDGAGGLGTLLLLNLFRDRLSLSVPGDVGTIPSER